MDPEEFLKLLIERLTLEDGKLKRSLERDKDTHPSLVFKKPVDLVIIGPCPTGYYGRSAESLFSSRELPKMLEGQKLVLIFPACCGVYSDEIQAMVRKKWQDIEFVFISYTNEKGAYWRDRVHLVAEELIKADVLML